MEKIKDQKSLLSKLKNDIKKTDKKTVVFLCGHFPLFYVKDSKMAIEAFYHWGVFSVFTLELGCEIAKYAQSIGKKIEFVFFVDDHAYEEMSGIGSREISKRRNNLYALRSGENAFLPDEYKKIMNKYGFSEKDVLRHNHKKNNRLDCLYFSEKILRLSEKKIDNICAREYTEFIEDKNYFDKKNFYMIAFVPNRCRGHICDVALNHEIKNLKASHIFMETMAISLTQDDLFIKGFGVTYRKD